MSKNEPTAFIVTAGQLARAQATRRGEVWGAIPPKERKHLVDKARNTLLVATSTPEVAA